jgi:hypothetical protein
MAVLIPDLGYDWPLSKWGNCISELVELSRGERVEVIDVETHTQSLPFTPTDKSFQSPPVTITCKSADSLDHLADGSVDAVVI